MSHEKPEFAEFFQTSWEPCLRAVVASTGSVQLAEDQVAEAFARAWLSWRKVRRHPAPRPWVVRTALRWSWAWPAAGARPGQRYRTTRPRPRSIWRPSRSSPAPTVPRR